MAAGADSGCEPVAVAPLFLGLVESTIDPLEQHDQALSLTPLGNPLAQGEMGSHI